MTRMLCVGVSPALAYHECCAASQHTASAVALCLSVVRCCMGLESQCVQSRACLPSVCLTALAASASTYTTMTQDSVLKWRLLCKSTARRHLRVTALPPPADAPCASMPLHWASCCSATSTAGRQSLATTLLLPQCLVIAPPAPLPIDLHQTPP